VKKKKGSFKPLRWTLTQAAAEFVLNPRTVVTRAKEAGILPGKDGKFSTADIHKAICGDYEKERTRKMTEDANRAARENAEADRLVVDKPDLLKRFETVFAEMKQRILNSEMADEKKNALLNAIADLESS
jgi:hypothetical protein